MSPLVTKWAQEDPRVTYHGFVFLENLANLFAISDAVVVPSLCYEGSPTIIYESLQAGVPVIASDIGGGGGLGRPRGNGYLFMPGDAESLRAALLRLADGTDRLHERDEEIRGGVEPFSIEHYVEKLEGYLTA